MQEDYDLQNDVYKDETVLSIVVVGASGDLARKKIFPALFALYYQGLLPKHVQIVGYARSKTTTEEFREKIYSTLGCRIDAKCVPHHGCDSCAALPLVLPWLGLPCAAPPARSSER